MRLSKRRTAYAAVLGLGLVVLILDRTVFDSGMSGPAPASAAEPGPATRASLVGSEALDRGLAVLSVGERLERFRQTREGAGISDAFAAVGGWFEKAAHRQAPAAPVDPADFKLTGLSGQLVSVNGKVLLPGCDTELTGDVTRRKAIVRLVSSGNRGAVIETDGQQIELRLSDHKNESGRK